ncbi:EP300-interacting inhibitor of differentiation 3-like [Xenia sp. Carnegie-2017]|uniref:EP300-interacting inhibitor of differentiation 3-like n=1 Tax=Xenia sp. Carnegie-2017 TaxID=2897299 RepID=UPI001F049941|nr:EP300-interacting inhibitor of differentiation 3-like [Xenia sp. Carnegie-2017]
MSGEDKYDNLEERRNLRFQYRQLIHNTEQKRHELVQPECNALHKTLGEGDELFQNVSHTREAALDSQLLVLLSNLGTEQAQHLQTGVVTFEPRMFAEKLITFMGGRCAGHETDEEGNLQDVNLDNLDWNKLGNIAAKSFHRTTGLEFMHGPLSMDLPPAKQRKQPKPKSGEKPGATAKITPQQLDKVENNEEATTKEVQRVYEALVKATPGDDDRLSFFEFVTNPDSFSQTVENIFHLSFLINKGNAAIELDEDDLPVVYATDPYSEKDYENEICRKQVVMQFTMEDWRDVLSTFNINTPIIPTRKSRYTDDNSELDIQDMDQG